MSSDAHQVLVVGAGVAGLSVTATLAEAGLDVVCLEARERVGGRLLSVAGATDHLDGAGNFLHASPGLSDREQRSSGQRAAGALDLGATWFWSGESRVERLITRLGIEAFAQHTAGDGLYEDRTRVRRLTGNPIGAPALRYVTGAQSLAVALAATVPIGVIRLSTAVSAITSHTDRLHVETADAQHWSADHVVLAIPPALTSSIRFDPGLPPQLAQVAAATPVWMGAVTKAVVQYREPFWRVQGMAGSAISERGPLREIHDMSGPDADADAQTGTGVAALFGFAPSSLSGHAPTSATETAFERAVIEQLVRLFGPRAARPARIVIQDWTQQRYTCSPAMARLTDYQLFGHPGYDRPALQGRLHWAATETSPVNAGHVEGALAAAHRAAAQVLATVRATREQAVITSASE